MSSPGCHLIFCLLAKSAMSSSRTVVRFQCSPLLLSSVFLMTQSITITNNKSLLHIASRLKPVRYSSTLEDTAKALIIQVSDDVDVHTRDAVLLHDESAITSL